MHELSIVQSLIEVVETELLAATPAHLPPPRVLKLNVKIGGLSGVVPEALQSAFSTARLHSSVSSAALSIQFCPVVVWCDACGDERTLPDPPQRFRCPVCDAATPKILSGRELELSSIEVSDDAAPNP